MTRTLILSVTPRGAAGIFVGQIEGTELRITATKNPLLSAARSLLTVGADPKTVLIMRNSGSSADRVSGQLWAIVKKTGRKGPRAALSATAGGSATPARGRRARQTVAADP